MNIRQASTHVKVTFARQKTHLEGSRTKCHLLHGSVSIPRPTSGTKTLESLLRHRVL